MIEPGYNQFVAYCKQGNIIPVYKAVTADLLTPVLAFLKIQSSMTNAFLLESVEGGEKIARYSFLGCNPYLTLCSRGETVEIKRGGQVVQRKGNLLEVMRETTNGYRTVRVPGLPPFTGGAVGYFAYDTVRWIENIPHTGWDDLNLDESVLMFFANLLAFDHVRQQILIISNVFIDEGAAPLEAKYGKAVSEIEALEDRLNRPAAGARSPSVQSPLPPGPVQFYQGRLSQGRPAGQGVHQGRGYFSGRPLAAVYRRGRDGSLHHLSSAANGEPVALHVLPAPQWVLGNWFLS